MQKQNSRQSICRIHVSNTSWRYLTDSSSSQNKAQGHFKVVSHARIKIHARSDQKRISPIGIPQLGCLRGQDMNSALQSRNCRGERSLRPTDCNETLYISHLGRADVDVILRSSKNGTSKGPPMTNVDDARSIDDDFI